MTFLEELKKDVQEKEDLLLKIFSVLDFNETELTAEQRLELIKNIRPKCFSSWYNIEMKYRL